MVWFLLWIQSWFFIVKLVSLFWVWRTPSPAVVAAAIVGWGPQSYIWVPETFCYVKPVFQLGFRRCPDLVADISCWAVGLLMLSCCCCLAVLCVVHPVLRSVGMVKWRVMMRRKAPAPCDDHVLPWDVADMHQPYGST